MRSAGLTASLFTLGFALQQVVATGWTDYGSFGCPANTNNDCDNDQKNGLDWQDLNLGSFASYGGFDFQGFECKNYNGKRDEVTRRTFNGKCASGVAKKDQNSSPSFSCPADQPDKKFSIYQMDVSVDIDIDIEFHYTMEDGSSCKQVSSCKKSGSTVQNTQCGGAKQVAVKLPDNYQGGDCGVNIHSIKFDCNHASSTKPVTKTKTYTTAKHTTAKPVTTTTSTSTTQTYTSATSTTTSAGETTTATYTTSTSSIPTAVYTSSTTAEATTTSTTVIVYTSTTTTPVTETITSGNSTYVTTTNTATTVYVSSASTIGTTAGPETTTSTTSTTAAGTTEAPTTTVYTTTAPAEETTTSPTATPVNCPSILPKCLNTWIFNTGCSDNADTDCFCPQPDFTNNVVACVQAWGGDDAEVQSALSYLAGLCANHIAENPAIITACPSSITLGYAPTATVTAAGQTYPVTTLSVYQTVTVPCVQSTGVSAGYTIAGSSTVTVISTAVIVPQVALVSQSSSVYLAAGTTPAQVAAYPTTAYTLTTSYKAAGATNTTVASPFLGAASSSRMSAGGLVAAVAVGLVALVL